MTNEQLHNNVLCNLMNEHLQEMWAMNVRAGYHNATHLVPVAPGVFCIRFPGANRGRVYVDDQDRITHVHLFDVAFNPGDGVYRIEVIDAVKSLVGKKLFEEDAHGD